MLRSGRHLAAALLPLMLLPLAFPAACVTATPAPTVPTWGPLEPGSCVPGKPMRRYRARLWGAAGDACGGPFQDVMGARFDHPDGCEGAWGYWDVRDHRCDDARPALPGRGADGGVPVPAEGYADLHNHLLAHVAFGETVLWGRSFGEPAEVLAPIPEPLRRAHQLIEGFSATRSLAGLFSGHDEHGHPTYTGWPTSHLKTHQQSHVDWLFRAYQGGLRLVVVDAVNNQDMFGRGENSLGVLNALMGVIGARAEPAPHRTSNDMEAVEFQVRAAHALVDWVARHRGGWLELAETPEEAASLIERGKLALVLGSEVDHPFNCDLGRRCSVEHIREGLTKFEAMGLAVIFPTHHKETQFGGAANFQPLNTGHVRPCRAYTKECAAVGLRPKGETLVREMMSRGLLVDLGHAGDRPFDETMTVLESEHYPAFMSHAFAHPLAPRGSAEYTLTYRQLRRIDAVGGMVSIHGAGGEYAGASNQGTPIAFGCREGGGAFVQSYLYDREAMGGARMDDADPASGGQIGLAPDWNGFAEWPDGRFSNGACSERRVEATGEPLGIPPRLRYPFPLPASLLPAAVGAVRELGRMEIEGVAFDFNERGLAQAGLQPDLLEDMRLHGLSEADLDPFYRSARGFVEMWRRAREARVAGDRGWLRWIPPSATDLIAFDGVDATRLVRVADGVPICRLRATGQVGSLHAGTCDVVEGEPPRAGATVEIGEVRNANSGLCLEVRAASSRTGAAVRQARCNAAAHQRWTFVPVEPGGYVGELRVEHSGQCLAVRRQRAVQTRCADASPIALERVGNTFRIHPAPGACLQTAARRLDAGAPVVAARCPPPGRADFHWEMDGMREARDVERLFSTRGLAGTVAWTRAPDPALPEVVTAASGAALCRVGRALGTVADGGCQLPDGGSPRPRFETLRAATALRDDR